MAKNKNKNKNKNSNQGNKNVESRSKVVTDLTQEQVDKIDKFLEEEMPTEAIELSDEELVETKEDAQKIEDIKKTGNVDGYINKLHDMLVRIKAIEKKADEIKEQHLKDQATLASDKKTFEDYGLTPKNGKLTAEQIGTGWDGGTGIEMLALLPWMAHLLTLPVIAATIVYFVLHAFKGSDKTILITNIVLLLTLVGQIVLTNLFMFY
jgi:uncharacterized protein YoaH (UPF0181 family)